MEKKEGQKSRGTIPLKVDGTLFVGQCQDIPARAGCATLTFDRAGCAIFCPPPAQTHRNFKIKKKCLKKFYVAFQTSIELTKIYIFM